MSKNAQGALFALVAFGLFSTHDVFIKVLGGSYSPIQIIFFSVLLSFPLVTLMLVRDTTSGTLIPRHPWWSAIRTFAALITGICAFYAFSVLPLAEVYAILFASPLLITLLSIPILGEDVRLRRGLAVLVGLVGVLIVLRPGQTELTLGHAAALCCAVFSALASVIVRKIGNEERSVVLLIYPMLASFICMGIALPFVYEPMPLRDMGFLALIAVFAHVAMRFVIKAYQTGEAAIVAPMQYSQIIWATAFGMLFFGETPDLWTAIGAAVIIASGIYIVLRESKPGLSENTPVLNTRSRPETGTHPRVGSILEQQNEASQGVAKPPATE
ncbi:DMT family transporter [Pseudaestuariivita sp.]|uniref:DMT family transporter n=1 Tax=Pseudaestuariivita sp. TaxID=2211669 RepID=UPI004059298A